MDPDTGALDLKSLQRIVTPLTRLLGVLTRITLGIAVVVGLQFACISLGLTFSCGVTTSDTVYCWGMNNIGQLADGSTDDSAVPVKIMGQP